MKISFVNAASFLALTTVVTAQSLFVEDPNEDSETSLPLKYTAAVSVGYDDHFTSNSQVGATSSAYINASLGANYATYTPRTSWSVGASVSANKYFDDSNGDGVYYNGRINFDLNHRISNRTRYVNKTYLNYGIEPNYSYSFTPNSVPSEHLYYITDHAIGHRWTSRLATYTGIKVSGVNYHGETDSGNDRFTYGAYNNFRYSLSPQTVLTANFSYDKTDASGAAGDSTDITGSIGVEHKMSRNSYVTAQAGATHRDVSGGRSDYYSPYLNLALNNRINNQLSVRTYARYGIENYGTSQGPNRYDTNQSIRVGAEANYAVSDKLSFNAGVNYIRSDFSDGRDTRTNTAVGDYDQSLINPYIGFTYKLRENLFVDGSYHYTNSDSSISNSFSDYQRNRMQLGVSTTF